MPQSAVEVSPLVYNGAPIEPGSLVSKPAVCLTLGGGRGCCRYEAVGLWVEVARLPAATWTRLTN